MGDLIDRQAVIDAIEQMQMTIIGSRFPEERFVFRGMAEALLAVKELPSAQPEPQWIPCSERLPERGKEVLVTRDYDGRADHHKPCRYVEVASCYGDNDDIAWCSYSDEYKMSPRSHKVIAWMPLPEPYKEDDNDE